MGAEEEYPDDLTLGEAAKYLQVSKPTLRRILREHKIESVRSLRDKRVVYVRREDLERFRPRRLSAPLSREP